jgi:hypothetical protein
MAAGRLQTDLNSFIGVVESPSCGKKGYTVDRIHTAKNI